METSSIYFCYVIFSAIRNGKQHEKWHKSNSNQIKKEKKNTKWHKQTRNGMTRTTAKESKQKMKRKKTEERFNRLWNWIKNWLRTRLAFHWWRILFLMRFEGNYIESWIVWICTTWVSSMFISLLTFLFFAINNK